MHKNSTKKLPKKIIDNIVGGSFFFLWIWTLLVLSKVRNQTTKEYNTFVLQKSKDICLMCLLIAYKWPGGCNGWELTFEASARISYSHILGLSNQWFYRSPHWMKIWMKTEIQMFTFEYQTEKFRSFPSTWEKNDFVHSH